MLRTRLLNLLDKVSNLKWELIFSIKKALDVDFSAEMEKNKALKGLGTGRRCFVVGNGPSLKQMDLSKLRDEYVITVNNISSNSEIYKTLNSDCHILIDPGYAILDPSNEDDQVTINVLRDINYSHKKPQCIVGYEMREAFKKMGLEKDLNINYIYQHSNITDDYNKKIDLSANIPSSQNVIHAAILTAFHMNFYEIYLIGCDMTSVFLTYEADAEGQVSIAKDLHAYDYSSAEKKRLFKEFNIMNNETALYDYAKTFTIFRRLRLYAEGNDIQILNATDGGGLDVFKRVKFHNLFN